MSKDYEVIKQDQLTRVNDARGLEYFYRIMITTTAGNTLSVDIDEKDYTPEKTAPILQAAAKNADNIGQL